MRRGLGESVSAGYWSRWATTTWPHPWPFKRPPKLQNHVVSSRNDGRPRMGTGIPAKSSRRTIEIPTRGTLLRARILPRTPCPAAATHWKQQPRKLMHPTGSSTSWRNPPGLRTARGLSGNISRSSGVKTGYRARYVPCIVTVVTWSSTSMGGVGRQGATSPVWTVAQSVSERPSCNGTKWQS